MDTSLSRQKINKETMVLNHTLDQMDSTDIFRTIHLTKAEYSFFSSSLGTFPRIDHKIGHETSLTKLKKIEIISSIFSSYNRLKLEINKKKDGKSTNMLKLTLS